MVEVEDRVDRNEGKFDELYKMLKDDFGKDKVTYRDAKGYVDDYLTAKARGQTIDPDFKDPERAEQLMKEY